MAAHLAICPSLICICPESPIAMLPNAFMTSIPNSRSNPSGLPCIPNVLILVELPSSVDTVTILMLQHRWYMPPIVIMSTMTSSDQHPQSFMNSQYQLALNTASCQHKCFPSGALYLDLDWGEGCPCLEQS